MTPSDPPAEAPDRDPFSLFESPQPDSEPAPKPQVQQETESETVAPPRLPAGQTDLSLPIDWIMSLDPLNLKEEDLTSLVRFYRAKRLNFLALEQRPKAVKSSRGPAMSDEKAMALMDTILSGAIGGKSE